MTLRDELQAALGDAYLLERELGGGGMSRVFIAEEVRLKRRVVVKVLAPEIAHAVSAERFEREIHVAATLQHPCIVPVLTSGESKGLAYYTMPYVEGESLRAKLVAANGPLPVAEAVRVLRDVAGALAFAHERGIVHRDIKPENVLLSGDYALVTDFGIAKAISAARTNAPADAEGLTGVGSSIGTPKYMAPEQAAGDPDTDHRADIYAWGIMAYELLTGAPPFHGRPLHQLVTAHLTEAPVPLREKRAEVPVPLADLVMRTLEKNPAHRPQRARELVEALDTIATPAAMAAAEVSRKGSRRMLAGVGAIAAIAIVGLALLLSRPSTAASSDASIAVLPFVNMSGDPKNEYFSDGMTEELIDALARTGGLRVAARTSSFAFKGKTEDVKTIGRALGVATILEGSVRQAGDRVRITAQLIDAGTGYHRWSATYDRQLKDVFAVQDEISKAIVSALSIALKGKGETLVVAATADPVAHDLYLKARYEWNKRSAEGLASAANQFRAAVERDSNYARAWAGIAATYIILPQYTNASPDTTVSRALEAADRALALDSTLAEAHAVRGMAAYNYRFDWATADREFLAAMRLDSSYATAYHWYSHLLLNQARFDSAVAVASHASRIDPLGAIVNISNAHVLALAGRHDEADAKLQGIMRQDLSPALRGLAQGLIGDNLLRRGLWAEALIHLDSATIPGAWGEVFRGDRVKALARLGRMDEARRLTQDIESTKGGRVPIAWGAALAHVGLGEVDSAVVWLEHAVDQPGKTLVLNHLAGDPMLEPLRGNARFQALMTRMKLPMRPPR